MEVHGEYKITVYKHCIVVKISGQWNYEGVIKYIEDVKKEILKISDEPWGFMVDFLDWELFTPDTEDPVNDFQIWCKEKNQKYEASVIEDNNIKKYQVNRYMEKLDFNVIEQRYFKESIDAIKWFQELDLF